MQSVCQEGGSVTAATSVVAHLVWIMGVICSFFTGFFGKPLDWEGSFVKN